MLSRVAESMYWMSRYVERAENVARFIDVHQALTLGGEHAAPDQWAALVHTTGDQGLFEAKYGAATREGVLRFLTFDREYPNSILSCLERARENGRTIRDNISLVMWEELNKFFHMVRDASGQGDLLEEPAEFYSRVRLASHLLQGVTESTMSHGEAFHFGRLGRLIERADKTSRILDVKYFLLVPEAETTNGTPLDVVQWSALLHSADGFAMYRREHGRLSPTKVAAFLVLDRLFPRAIRHCVIHAEESLHAITGTPIGGFDNRAEQRLGRLRSELDYTTIEEILEVGLHESIDDLQRKLNSVGDAISACFFAVERAAGLPTRATADE